MGVLSKVHYVIRNADDSHIKDVFPCNGDKEVPKVATDWADNYGRTKREVETLTLENLPIKKLTITDLDKRNEGGRAYKVLIDVGHNYIFRVDLREYTMMDIIENVGIFRGGLVYGDFVWIQRGSQYSLVRVGSPLYEEQVKEDLRLKEVNELKSSVKVTPKDLVEGQVYTTISTAKYKSFYLYLGKEQKYFKFYSFYDVHGKEDIDKKLKSFMYPPIRNTYVTMGDKGTYKDVSYRYITCYKSLPKNLMPIDIKVDLKDLKEVDHTFYRDCFGSYVDISAKLKE